MRSLLLRCLLIFPVLAGLALWCHRTLDFPVGMDDANIFFVYAQNLADGHGFVYNPGGERVEGFSSLLWTLLITPFFWVSAHPEKLLYALNLSLLTAGLAALTRELDRLYTGSDIPSVRPTLPSLVLLLWMIVLPTPLLWGVLSLLDSGLWMTELLLATALLLGFLGTRHTDQSLATGGALVVAAMVVSRPEALAWGLYFALGYGLLLWLRQRANTTPVRWSLCLTPLITWGASLAALLTFRLTVFGYPLPNTYYAKVSSDHGYNLQEGALYLKQFLLGHNGDPAHNLITFPLAVLVAAGFLHFGIRSLRILRPSDEPTNLLPVILLWICGQWAALVAILLYVGGDMFPAYRFIYPFWFILAAPLLALLFRFKNAHPLPALVVALLTCTSAGLLSEVTWSNFRSKDAFAFMFRLANSGRITGTELNRVFAYSDPMPTVGSIAAGGIKVGYDGPIMDLMGLNHTGMAHSTGKKRGLKAHASFSKNVFYEYTPELLWPIWTNDPVAIPQDDHYENRYLLHGLVGEPDFMALYALITLDTGAAHGEYRYLHVYIRNDWLAEQGSALKRYSPKRTPHPKEELPETKVVVDRLQNRSHPRLMHRL